MLGPGRKTIHGAKEFISVITSKKVKNIVLGVGSNDLSNKNTNTCVAEMKNLIERTAIIHKFSNIHILPTFERVGEHAFNRKVKDFNTEIEKFKTKSGCAYIENSLIFSEKENMYSDGIHFSELGQKSLVVILKTHLNPILGLKPYNEYQQAVSHRRKQGPRPRQTQQYRYPHPKADKNIQVSIPRYMIAWGTVIKDTNSQVKLTGLFSIFCKWFNNVKFVYYYTVLVY